MAESITYNYNFKIRFRDTDSYGVVHHSNYFCYFEEARFDFAIKMLGLYEKAAVSSIKFPVLEASCIFKRALTYEKNNFYVNLEFRTLKNTKLEFLYQIKCKSDNKIYADGRTVHAILKEDGSLYLSIPNWLNDMIVGLGKENG